MDVKFNENKYYGYIADDLTKPVRLKGRTKMLKYEEQTAGEVPQLLTTYNDGDYIPTRFMSIDTFYEDENYETGLFAIGNDSETFKKISELMELVVNDNGCSFRGVDLKNVKDKKEKFQEILNDYFKEKNIAPEDQDSYKIGDELAVTVFPTALVYNTAASRKENMQTLRKYFEIEGEKGVIYESKYFDFILYHKRDLIECFKGKENLIEFINSLDCEYLDDNQLAELIDEINNYSPEEIANGIDVRQGEIDEIMIETTEQFRGDRDEKEEEEQGIS